MYGKVVAVPNLIATAAAPFQRQRFHIQTHRQSRIRPESCTRAPENHLVVQAQCVTGQRFRVDNRLAEETIIENERARDQRLAWKASRQPEH